MENKELFEKMALDVQDLENINGGMSESRKDKIRGYVERFKARGYKLNSIKYYWRARSENAAISSAQMEEDFDFIESVY